MINRKRLFIAVPLPDDLKRIFTDLIRKFEKTGANVKWVEEENLHITLKFLGETPIEKIEPVISSISKVISSVSRFTMDFKGVGAFPRINYPRVIWIGVTQGRNEIGGIERSLEKEMETLGFPLEKNRFSPHITLGRVKSNNHLSDLADLMASFGEKEFGGYELKEIDLMESRLTKKGPVYSTLRRFPLIKEAAKK